MIRLGNCPHCQKITAQNIVKSLKTTTTTCRVCQTTLNIEYKSRKRLQAVKRRMTPKPQTVLKNKVWRELVKNLTEHRAKFLCEICHVAPTWLPLQGHHIIKRSQGRIDTEENCLILCHVCHNHSKYGSGTPLSTAEQLALVKRLQNNTCNVTKEVL